MPNNNAGISAMAEAFPLPPELREEAEALLSGNWRGHPIRDSTTSRGEDVRVFSSQTPPYPSAQELRDAREALRSEMGSISRGESVLNTDDTRMTFRGTPLSPPPMSPVGSLSINDDDDDFDGDDDEFFDPDRSSAIETSEPREGLNEFILRTRNPRPRTVVREHQLLRIRDSWDRNNTQPNTQPRMRTQRPTVSSLDLMLTEYHSILRISPGERSPRNVEQLITLFVDLVEGGRL